MKSLYETILASTGAGRGEYNKRLILDPYNRIDELNKLWKSYALAFDAGFGEGKWCKFMGNSLVYYVQVDKTGRKEELALIGKDYASDIVVSAEIKGVKRTPIKKWAEKVARMFNMYLQLDKNYIYLKFLS